MKQDISFDEDSIFKHLTSNILFQDDAMRDMARVVAMVMKDLAYYNEFEAQHMEEEKGAPCDRDEEDKTRLITPLLLSGPDSTGKVSSVDHLVKLFDMQEGGANEKAYIQCDMEDHVKDLYYDMCESIYTQFCDALTHYDQPEAEGAKNVIVILVENAQDARCESLLSIKDFMEQGFITNGSMEEALERKEQGLEQGEFKLMFVPAYVRVLIIFTANFASKHMKPSGTDGRFLIYDRLKELIEEEHCKSQGKLMALLMAERMPFIPLSKRNMHQLLLTRFDKYLNFSIFCDRFGTPTTNDPLKIIELMLINHQDDGNCYTALHKLEIGMRAFTQSAYDHFISELSRTQTTLSPPASFVCEYIPYDEGLNERMMSKPLFKYALSTPKNKRSYEAIIWTKSGIGIFTMEHPSVKNPCIRIVTPCVKQYFPTTNGSDEEYRDKFHDTDKKVSNIIADIGSSDRNDSKIARIKSVDYENSQDEEENSMSIHEPTKRNNVEDDTLLTEEAMEVDVKINDTRMFTCDRCKKVKSIHQFRIKKKPSWHELWRKKEGERVCKTCYQKK
jgi:hypothetical protein